MGRAKIFTQVKEVSETTTKRFEEITLYMFINQINKTENPDIIIEGLATAARCKRDSILRAESRHLGQVHQGSWGQHHAGGQGWAHGTCQHSSRLVPLHPSLLGLCVECLHAT